MRAILLILLVGAAFSSFTPAISLPPSQSTSEPQVREFVARFFSAYAQRDTNRFRSLWSARAPDYETRLPAIVGRLDRLAQLEILSLQIREIQAGDENARVRVLTEIRAEEKATGKPADGFGRMNRILILVREEDDWKVSRYFPAEDEVLDAIVAATGESERLAAATRQPELATPELVKAIHTRGFRLSNGGEYQAAMDLHLLAERLAGKIGDELGVIVSLKNQGDVHAERREHAKALGIFARCIAYFREHGRSQDIPDVLNSMAAIQYRSGEKSKALDTFQEALKLAESAADRYTVANTLNNMGIIYGDLGRPEDALKAYERSEQAYRELGDRSRAALMIQNRAAEYSNMRQFPKALDLFAKALTEFRAMNNRLWTGVCLRAIGNVHAKEDRLPEATRHYEESLALLDRQEDRVQLASTLHNLASMYVRLGNSKRALELLERCRDLRTALSDHAGTAATLERIAAAQISLGNFEAAVQAGKKARDLQKTSPEQANTIRTLNTLAAAYVYQGDAAGALEVLHQARQALEASGSTESRVEVLNNLGAVYSGLGDRQQRDRFLQTALRLRERDGGDTGGILLNIAGAEIDDGRTEEGSARLRRLMDRAGQPEGGDGITAYASRNLGDVYAAKREYARAEAYYRRSLKIAERLEDRNTIVTSLVSLSQFYRKQRRLPAALQAISRARTVSESTGSRDVGVWTELGNVYRAADRATDARQAYEQAVAITEDVRSRFTLGEDVQQRFFESHLEAYHGLIALHLQTKRTELAFLNLERVKGRVLLDVLRGGRIPTPATLTPGEVSEERRLYADLISMNAQLRREMARAAPDRARLQQLRSGQAEARRAWDAFRTGLYAAHPELRVVRAELTPITLAEAQGMLGRDTAALEYSVASDRTYITIISGRTAKPGAPRAERRILTLPLGREELARRVEAFRRQVSNPNRGLPTNGRSLYELLVRPAENALRGKARLIISPDGPLWDLPFQALQNAGGKFLMEAHAISYTPSLTVLRETRRRNATRLASTRPAGRSIPILAVADPVIASQTARKTEMVLRVGRYERLPEAAREAQTLGEIYGTGSRVYVGAQATETRVKAEVGHARVLHLASHGVLQDSSPLYSFILLADTPGSEEDGLLEAWEILQLPLRAEVVVLSACETARGRAASGEGVIGLSWAVFVAGCPTAVLSQWEVESRSTSQLMLDFHRKLRRNMIRPGAQKNTAEALRSAALELRKNRDYRHPFYWAGFAVMGDGD